ncbi:Bifunctional uridylyltransferase/uridylyl-removing enzyme [bacterium HR39]|nr:Bifunctional uridylyltransferase/uridylyl-removing enzyme [bacterium HR39]
MRSVEDTLRLCREDAATLTALLEPRLVWGSKRLFDELTARFRPEAIRGLEQRHVEAILEDREKRHARAGDSRYLLEPNVKEGKGGLRDLQNLLWLGRVLFDARSPADLVRHGLMSEEEERVHGRLRRALWRIRCALHFEAGRAEERLTFDLQPKVARALGYRGDERRRVERLMRRYYMIARDVGHLTRVVCTNLDAQGRRRRRLRLPFGRRRIGDFVVEDDRLSVPDPDLFAARPVAMLELFRIAQERGLDIHPRAFAAIRRHLKRIDASVREDPAANRLFLDILTSPRDPAGTLSRMHEAGVLGQFVPEFRRIEAQFQHTLYHVYTTDEHTIRAIDVLHRIEKGELADQHPLSAGIFPQVKDLRTELYLSVFLHDIGKGRARDHSEVGEEIARRLCPRFGLAPASTELVAWLVRHHLLMTRFAFSRDIDDPKTAEDFVAAVQSPERLRLLVLLTVADIRAVAPNAWNAWRGQLLRELYYEAIGAMTAGDVAGRRRARLVARRNELADRLRALGRGEAEVEAWLARHEDAYFLAFEVEELVEHARAIAAAEERGEPLVLQFRPEAFPARTRLFVFAPDHPGLFMRIAGALAASGTSILDARIFTTRDGMALDVLDFQDPETRTAVDDPGRLSRIRANLEGAIRGGLDVESRLRGRRIPRHVALFRVEPRVRIDNAGSRTSTVVEVQARDRPGLLYDLARAFLEQKVSIKSAHITTYGERAVDVFYVRDLYGMKLTRRPRIESLERALLEAIRRGEEEAQAA